MSNMNVNPVGRGMPEGPKEPTKSNSPAAKYKQPVTDQFQGKIPDYQHTKKYGDSDRTQMSHKVTKNPVGTPVSINVIKGPLENVGKVAAAAAA